VDVLKATEDMIAKLPDSAKELPQVALVHSLAYTLTAQQRNARDQSTLARTYLVALDAMTEAVNGARKQGDIVDQIAAKRAARRAATKGRASAKKADGQPG
jgi:hypothetical protein